MAAESVCQAHSLNLRRPKSLTDCSLGIPPLTRSLTSTPWDAFSTTFSNETQARRAGWESLSVRPFVQEWSINEPLFRCWFDLPALSGETLQNRFVHAAAVITSALLASNIAHWVCLPFLCLWETERGRIFGRRDLMRLLIRLRAALSDERFNLCPRI